MPIVETMNAPELVAEAKKLIAEVEQVVKAVEHAEPTQLRIAVRRLELFLEQLVGAVPKASEPQVEEEPEVEGPEAAPAQDEPKAKPTTTRKTRK